MLSFKLLQDVQNYINGRTLHGAALADTAAKEPQAEYAQAKAAKQPQAEYAPVEAAEQSKPANVMAAVPKIAEEPKIQSEARRRARWTDELPRITFSNLFSKKASFEEETEEQAEDAAAYGMSGIAAMPSPVTIDGARQDIASRLAEKDESFSEHLIRKIDELKMTDVDCYTRAQVSRQLFNKIKNTKDYRPSKNTVIALGFALNLVPEEFDGLLASAGYTLSNNNDFDLIVDYCLVHRISSIDDINELLFSFDQPLLGSR